VAYQRQAVNFKDLLEDACRSLSVSAPKILKGVKGLTNEDKTPEIIEKGDFAGKARFISLQGWNNSIRRH